MAREGSLEPSAADAETETETPTEAVAADGESTSTPGLPPFPERRELFIPPQGVDPALARAAGKSSTGVMLKGFVQVDGVRVLVDVNGQIAVLGEGEHHEGLRVVRLEPPIATFERGAETWSTSLWDDLDLQATP